MMNKFSFRRAFNAGFASGVAALDDLTDAGIGSQTEAGKSDLEAIRDTEFEDWHAKMQDEIL